MNERRRDAARRVAAQHPPLPQIFAAMRASLGETPPPAPPPVSAGHPDDVALSLALGVEDEVREHAAGGARAARDAGVPGDADVGDAALDAVLAMLQSYAASGTSLTATSPELLDRVRGVARSAGVVAAVRDTGWIVRQRFAGPPCPRPACADLDGRPLTAERVAVEGLPPYGDGCTCVAEATRH